MGREHGGSIAESTRVFIRYGVEVAHPRKDPPGILIYIHIYIRRNQPVNTVETESKNEGEEMRVKSCASTGRKSKQDWNLVNWKCVY